MEIRRHRGKRNQGIEFPKGEQGTELENLRKEHRGGDVRSGRKLPKRKIIKETDKLEGKQEKRKQVQERSVTKT